MKMFVLALLVVRAAALSTMETMEDLHFDAWSKAWKKKYTGAEYNMRKGIFEDNKQKVVKHNAEYRAGKHTWSMALNFLADYTSKEFAMLRSHKYAPSSAPIVTYTNVTSNPASIDWRSKGAVTSVKNQGGCGSCWAFSATESVESMYQIASGKLIKLAPQAYVNCVKNPHECGGKGGCEGATMELAFNLTVTKGIALESDLPYKGHDEKCSNYKPAVKASGYVKNPVNDAAGLETALAKEGPQSVTVAAASWQFYNAGIYNGCSGSRGDNTLDHGVQAVGYSDKYWIVRNSWGTFWGEKGYIRLSRSADGKTFTDKSPEDGTACKPYPKTQTVGGECGVLFDTSYPTGVKAA